jgi:hypothetical protein
MRRLIGIRTHQPLAFGVGAARTFLKRVVPFENCANRGDYGTRWRRNQQGCEGAVIQMEPGGDGERLSPLCCSRRRQENLFLNSNVPQQALAKFCIGRAIDTLGIARGTPQRIVESLMVFSQITINFAVHNVDSNIRLSANSFICGPANAHERIPEVCDMRKMDQYGNRYSESAGEREEGPLARAIESRTSKLPSDTFLWMAGASIASSLTLRILGKKDAANWVGQWAPTLLILGVYNKMVRQHGHDETMAAA